MKTNCETPVPAPYVRRFEALGFGMFVHYGLYSQCNAGEWTYHLHHWEREKYMRLADTFHPGSLKQIVQVGKTAGCRYITLTCRHHDGFSLYDTRGLNTFDAPHSGAKRDLIKEFVELCREADLVPFFYHTTLDWTHPDFKGNFDQYLDYLYKSVEILCTHYGKIGGFWFDGNWSDGNVDWKEDRLYGMIRHYQPEAMIINNTGLEARGAMGAREIDAVTFERGLAQPLDLRGMEKYVTGEMCETLCDNWGKADDINFKSVGELVEELCLCRKVGANFLLNIGPLADASVEKIQEGIMECIGRWMDIYGDAIYRGRPYRCYPGRKDFLLKDRENETVAYLFRFGLHSGSGDKHVTLNLEEDGVDVFDGIVQEVKQITWIDNQEKLLFRQEQDRLAVCMTGFPHGQSLCVRVARIQFAEERKDGKEDKQ